MGVEYYIEYKQTRGTVTVPAYMTYVFHFVCCRWSREPSSSVQYRNVPQCDIITPSWLPSNQKPYPHPPASDPGDTVLETLPILDHIQNTENPAAPAQNWPCMVAGGY